MQKLNLKQRTLIGVILNFIIFIETAVAMVWQIVFRGDAGPLGEFGSGFGSLQTFTNESNILCALIALALAIVGIRNLIKQEYNFSHGWRILQLIGATAVFLTFTIVLIFLSPLNATQSGNFFELFSNSMFITHFLTPLLAALVFIFFTPSESTITTRDNFLVLIPVALYGVVYITNVVFLQIWPDFYHFTLGGKTQFLPLVIMVILAGTLGLARILIVANKKYQNKFS